MLRRGRRGEGQMGGRSGGGGEGDRTPISSHLPILDEGYSPSPACSGPPPVTCCSPQSHTSTCQGVPGACSHRAPAPAQGRGEAGVLWPGCLSWAGSGPASLWTLWPPRSVLVSVPMGLTAQGFRKPVDRRPRCPPCLFPGPARCWGDRWRCPLRSVIWGEGVSTPPPAGWQGLQLNPKVRGQVLSEKCPPSPPVRGVPLARGAASLPHPIAP